MRDLTTPLVNAVTSAPEGPKLLAESNCPPRGRLGRKRGGNKEEGRGNMGRKKLRRTPPADLAVVPILVSDDSDDEGIQDEGDENVLVEATQLRETKEREERRKDHALVIAPKCMSRRVDGGKGEEGRERSRLAAREAVKVKEWIEEEENNEARGRREMALFVGREGEPVYKGHVICEPTIFEQREEQARDVLARRTGSRVFTEKENPGGANRNGEDGAQNKCVDEDVDSISIGVSRSAFKASSREVEVQREEVMRAETQCTFESTELKGERLRNKGMQRDEQDLVVESLSTKRGAENEPIATVRDEAVVAGSTITVKVELDEDLRRLRIDSSWSFKMLSEELRTLFRIQGSFGVRYRDEEYDYVTIASDKDMRELFTVVSEHSLVPLRMKIVL